MRAVLIDKMTNWLCHLEPPDTNGGKIFYNQIHFDTSKCSMLNIALAKLSEKPSLKKEKNSSFLSER